jgi:DNA repair exonuclease SbcCD nuclease subunit
MTGFRFVHLADAHLDAPFASGSPDVRKLLAESLRRSFQGAVDIALDERVHAFLIAGDLVESPEPSLSAEHFLLGQLRRLSEASIPVFYGTGNHDPLAVRTGGRRIDWPKGVTVYTRGEPLRSEVLGPSGEPIAQVTGAGHERAEVGENLAARFPAAAGPLPEVALLHASVEGTKDLDPRERYAPCSARDLRGKGYDYWALGHVHKRHAALDDPAAHYPGSILGLDRTEIGEKGVLLVEIVRGEPPRVEFRRTAPVVREEMEVDVREAASVEALRRLLHERILALGDPRSTLLTVRLAGTSPLKPDLERKEDLRELEEGLAGEIGLAHLSLRTQDLRCAVDLGRVRVGPLAAALDLVAALREGTASFDPVAPAELAGIAPAGAAERDRYLRSLLDGAEEEIARRMWKEGP